MIDFGLVDEPVDEDTSESPVDFVLGIHVAAIGECSGLWRLREGIERQLEVPKSTTSYHLRLTSIRFM